MTAWFIIGFILVTIFVVHCTPKLMVWSLSLLVYLFITHYLISNINSVVFFIFALVSLAITVIFNIKPLRKLLITNFIFRKAKSVLPKISDTEQLALNAGDPWYEKEIFQGKPDFKLLHSLKKFELSTEEQQFLNTETVELCSMIDDWHITHVEKDLPINVWNFIREKGFFGLVIALED